jgi:hypothetical protein
MAIYNKTNFPYLIEDLLDKRRAIIDSIEYYSDGEFITTSLRQKSITIKASMLDSTGRIKDNWIITVTTQKITFQLSENSRNILSYAREEDFFTNEFPNLIKIVEKELDITIKDMIILQVDRSK